MVEVLVVQDTIINLLTPIDKNKFERKKKYHNNNMTMRIRRLEMLAHITRVENNIEGEGIEENITK